MSAFDESWGESWGDSWGDTGLSAEAGDLPCWASGAWELGCWANGSWGQGPVMPFDVWRAVNTNRHVEFDGVSR